MAEPTASHDSLTVEEYLKLEEGRSPVLCPETTLSLAEVYEGLE
jgi:hypothetical protein